MKQIVPKTINPAEIPRAIIFAAKQPARSRAVPIFIVRIPIA